MPAATVEPARAAPPGPAAAVREPRPPAEAEERVLSGERPVPAPMAPRLEREAVLPLPESIPARRREPPVVSAPTRLLVFTRGGKEYGLDPMKVEGIHPAEGITMIPGMGGHACGVKRIGERGITVLDVGWRSGAGNFPATAFGRLVALGAEHAGFALLADSVSGIVVFSDGVFTAGEADAHMMDVWEFSGGSRLVYLPDVSVLRGIPAKGDRVDDRPPAGGFYIVFELAGGSYAIPAEAVEAVRSRTDEDDRKDGGEPPLRSVNLYRFLGEDTATAGVNGEAPRQTAVIVSHGNLMVEVPVRRVRGLRRIASTAIDILPRAEPGDSPVRAVARLSGEEPPVFILDPAAVCR